MKERECVRGKETRMAQALYRKYRSKSLDEIEGQQHVTDILRRTLENGRISHAYLLTGPRGVGKTSIARIIAHEINSLPYGDEDHLDIIEIDAASNNGVDDVRDLRDKVQIAPVSAKKKVYIIDEVHMLSKPAFNALLKTLEEPPEHVVFILATTEVQKLPDTILSRTQRFHFRPIKKEVMKKHLAAIAKKEKVALSDDALDIIAERAEGSFRDGITLLDQLSNLGDQTITAEVIEAILGIAPKKQVSLLIEAITKSQLEKAVQLLTQLEEGGVSAVVLSQQLISALKDHIATQPQHIALIDALIEVQRSYDPALKLLAIVARFASSPMQQNPTEPSPKEAPPKSAALVTAPPPSIVTTPPKKPSAAKMKAPEESSKKAQSLALPEKIDWQAVMEYIRSHHMPLYGVLKNANEEYNDGQLHLHFTYSLHKKKLDSGKYRQMLTECLVHLYETSPEIVTSSGKLPPKSEQARNVAAIMGGGEEVKVDG